MDSDKLLRLCWCCGHRTFPALENNPCSPSWANPKHWSCFPTSGQRLPSSGVTEAQASSGTAPYPKTYHVVMGQVHPDYC